MYRLKANLAISNSGAFHAETSLNK